MLNIVRGPEITGAERKHGFLPALAIALMMHVVLFWLPGKEQSIEFEQTAKPIEIQLQTFRPSTPLPRKLESKPEPGPIQPEIEARLEPSLPIQNTQSTASENDLQGLSQERLEQLTHAIWSRPFTTRRSASDNIFAIQPGLPPSQPQREFHYPDRRDMLTMLNQPMPDLPFAYTPGLVYFAYEPGVRGDLQRFWDTITPEFGWRTDNGTEFRCKWVLVIVGCGWK